MSKVSAWWSSLGFGKPVRAPEPDFADMGTAFGLDASMDTVPAAYNAPAYTSESRAGAPTSEHAWRPSR